MKACTKPLLWDTNYDRENIDYKNVSRPHRFKWCNFLTNFHDDIVPHARHFLPVNFFPKY